jgi:UDP-3-O-[3-hydroxymyristoyl] N-acetylglucosamine deacetylase/3-hydroxyacyl-[acyl-carrier-protein] dehydratase
MSDSGVFRLSGTGIHTGRPAEVEIRVASTGSGIVFVRTDLPDAPRIPARLEFVSPTARCTRLACGNADVTTPEHLLAALAHLHFWDVEISLNGPEVPILDGSALPWVEGLQAHFPRATQAPKPLVLRKKLEWTDPVSGAQFQAEPAGKSDFQVRLDYPESSIGICHAQLSENFLPTAQSRTFSFLHELKPLMDAGLLQGLAPGAGVVFVHPNHPADDDLRWMGALGQELTLPLQPGPLELTPLRVPDEAAQHKLLDLCGDLALLGAPLHAKITATRPGHVANAQFAKLLLETMEEKTAPIFPYNLQAPPLMDVVQIQKVLPHRPPFLLVDRIMEMSETHVVGTKAVTMNEPHFVGHFPGAPVMPGVLIIEAMAQCGGILALSTVPDPENYLTFFLKMDDVKFKQKVVPGDTLVFHLELMEPIRRGIVKMIGKAYVGEKCTTEAVLTALITKDNK